MRIDTYDFTILEAEPGQRLAKLYRDPDDDPEPYDAGHRVLAHRLSGASWGDFVGILADLTASMCLIRGGIRPDAVDDVDAGLYVRRLVHDREDCPAAFEPAPRNWIVLDADDTTTPFDVADPLPSIIAWHASLPEQIRAARSAFFLSASAHRSPTVRGKLLVALDSPCDDATASAFARANGFDSSVCNAVQPNYFAAPIFDGCADPLEGYRVAFPFDGAAMHLDVTDASASTNSLGARDTSTHSPNLTDRVIEVAALVVDRWLAGNRVETNAWLHLAGWLIGRGWTRAEIAALLEVLDDNEPDAKKRAEHRRILANARAIEGPGGAREWLGSDFASVDTIVNAAADAMVLRREAAHAANGGAFRPAATDDPDIEALPSLILDEDKQGRPKPTPLNVARVVDHVFGDAIRLEDCTGRVVVADAPESCGDFPDGAWTDPLTTEMTQLCNALRLQVSSSVVREVIVNHARKRHYNALTEYVLGLADKWDGIPRVDRAMSTYWRTEDTAATRAAGRVFLLSLVARALEPGCKVDTALMLIGPQGLKKSFALQELVGEAWFADSPLEIGNKEGLQTIRGKWLWEIQENSSATRRDRNAVKAFLSARRDTFRASYGHFTETIPRQTVFAISSNDAEPLNDPTGARRYLPVWLTERADLIGLRRDHEQLLAEAAVRVIMGEQYWPTEDEDRALDIARGNATDITVLEDAWDEAIGVWVSERNGNPFRTWDVVDEVSGAVRLRASEANRQVMMRVADVLRRLGMQKRRETGAGGRGYYWHAPPAE